MTRIETLALGAVNVLLADAMPSRAPLAITPDPVGDGWLFEVEGRDFDGAKVVAIGGVVFRGGLPFVDFDINPDTR